MTSFLGLTRTLLLSLLIVSVVADGYGHDDNGKGNGNGHGNGGCRNPKVRREWRALSTRERGDWIKAVNVRTPFVIFPLSNALIDDS